MFPVNLSAQNLVLKALCDDVIVDAPTNVVVPGATAIRPPGVFVRLLPFVSCAVPYVVYNTDLVMDVRMS